MTENSSNDKDAEIVSIMSRNSEIAYRFYKQRFDDAMTEYQAWKKQNSNDYPAVVEWRSLLEGDELRQKMEMWFGVCVKLREHIEKKRLRHS